MSFQTLPTLVLSDLSGPTWATPSPLDATQEPGAAGPGAGPAAGPDAGPQPDLAPITRDELQAGRTEADGSKDKGNDEKAPQGGFESCFSGSNLPILIGFPIIIYFLIVRPAQKQEKARKQMQSALGKGSKIVTTGGLHGTVAAMDETTVTIKVAGDQRLTFDRSAIGRILTDGAGGDGSSSVDAIK